MNKTAIERYLRTYGASEVWQLTSASTQGIERAVVIPALAESTSLFRTLASLAANPASELSQTLVICVVNNHEFPLADAGEIGDNQETLETLDSLVFARRVSGSGRVVSDAEWQRIADSGLRLAYIDAASPGREIPEHEGGVGSARKIGMDRALAVIDPCRSGPGIICCLDADTIVQKNYLEAVSRHFMQTKKPAAVTVYAHQRPNDPRGEAAICGYEIFLRSYVIGLAYAGSPYAYHAIGSTMACTADAYLAVRGMNRRNAAEDFHFLNKLAKIGKIGTVTETTVFPSARPSHRVPFGTGRSMMRFLSGERDESRLYDPRIFPILREWLAGVERDPGRNTQEMIAHARDIHESLGEYLLENRFDRDWQRIRSNCLQARQLRKQFHGWFDALKTLRAIHHIQRRAFPSVPMFEGLRDLLVMTDPDFPDMAIGDCLPEIDVQRSLLATLRLRFPYS